MALAWRPVGVVPRRFYVSQRRGDRVQQRPTGRNGLRRKSCQGPQHEPADETQHAVGKRSGDLAGIHQVVLGKGACIGHRHELGELAQRPSCAAQGIHRRDKGAVTGQLGAELLDGHAEVFGHQIVASEHDLAPNVDATPCSWYRFDGDIAFTVEAQRSVVEIRRADAQESVIDHHDLRMHVDRRATSDDRPIHAQPSVGVRAPEKSQQSLSGAVHRSLFESALRTARQNDDHFRPLGLP